ncbi:MAG: hypothetical protein HY608_04460 [Planctomycetes bacterium]|nr:hypothetical protein [Planctomycetota bacterium]
MAKLEEIMDAAQRLSEGDRRRLLEALQTNGAHASSEECHREALASWRSLAGTFHSDHADVSTDKGRHLGDVYADDR